MATSSPRSSNLLGRRSLLARLGAVLALIGCGFAIYFLVMNFTGDSESGEERAKPKNRSEQTRERGVALPVEPLGSSLSLRF
jgi:hypothetical protein